MIQKVQYPGFSDLTGSHFGSIRVEQLARRVPSVAWQCRCDVCASSFVAQHSQLVSGGLRKCPNASCGRNAHKQIPEPTFTPPSLEASIANPDAARAYLDSIDGLGSR
jgi:hypothetical protein